ncbi:TOM40 [Lepeophtheirus salmonis]|uniref:TOM40 n=1 Tax=Lepeophtheirus salmonis TaxID=72036 RepID=A0A7R8HE14_LEPSM|nr:TOM40 [Lepeophtheirus salmonis]CAF3021493.1 TOM40 [Lepeophtheirus salmonis]
MSMDSDKPTSNNPGTVEDLHKQCQSVYPLFFDGIKILLNKGLSSHFQVSHTLNLTNSDEMVGYRFDMDPKGDLNANIVHAFSKNFRAKAIAQIQKSKWVSAQFTGDYTTDNYTASFTLGNPDLINGTGVLVTNYLQAITRNLSLGAELAYQSTPQLPGGHMAAVTLVGRYANKNSAFACTLGGGGQMHASFYQNCGEGVQMGTEIEANLRMQDSVASIGYSIDVGNNGTTVMKGSVDTNCIVKSVIETKLLPLPFTLALCGLINHKKNTFQLGCGFIMG